jgi:hypothetical protein
VTRRPCQGLFGGTSIGEEFEERVVSEGVVVVLIGVTGEDTVDAGADHLQEGVFGEVGIAGIVEGVGEVAGQSEEFVELAEG